MLLLIENIQLKKIQEHILEILVTALLENIDLLLQFLMYMITKYYWSGSGILVCSVKTHFDQDKKWPKLNDMDNSDGCNAGMYIHTCTRFWLLPCCSCSLYYLIPL